MPAGDLWYRCRNCFREEAVHLGLDDVAAVFEAALGLRPPIATPGRSDEPPGLYATHACGRDERGVMDLVRVRLVSDPPPAVAAQASKSQGRDAADAA
jgi:hypothetical protein